MQEFDMKLTQNYIQKYKRSSKEEKTQILKEYCYHIGIKKNTAVQRFKRLLSSSNPISLSTVKYKKKKGRAKEFLEIHKLFIKEIWKLTGEICGEKVFPELQTYIDQFTAKNTNYPSEVVDKCRKISLITLKRIIGKFPKARSQKHVSKEMIYKNILVDPNFKRHANEPGYLEVDFVEHNGGNSSGQYGITCSYVDVCTGWHVRSATLGQSENAMRICHEKALWKLFYKPKEFHPDNNRALLKTLFEKSIGISRSRPYKKNDNAHVEQKNDDKIRKLVGYFRYDTQEQINLLNELYDIEDTISNFFIPSSKLKKRVYDKNGKLIKRIHDKPQTPYKRYMSHKKIPKSQKDELEKYYKSLNLVELREESDRIYAKLLQARSG